MMSDWIKGLFRLRISTQEAFLENIFLASPWNSLLAFIAPIAWLAETSQPAAPLLLMF